MEVTTQSHNPAMTILQRIGEPVVYSWMLSISVMTPKSKSIPVMQSLQAREKSIL